MYCNLIIWLVGWLVGSCAIAVLLPFCRVWFQARRVTYILRSIYLFTVLFYLFLCLFFVTGDAAARRAAQHLGRELRILHLVVLPSHVRPQVRHQSLPPGRPGTRWGTLLCLCVCSRPTYLFWTPVHASQVHIRAPAGGVLVAQEERQHRRFFFTYVLYIIHASLIRTIHVRVYTCCNVVPGVTQVCIVGCFEDVDVDVDVVNTVYKCCV